jgi:hypothetical protein
MSIRDLVETTGAPAILAVTCPKNNDDEQALGDQLFTALGVKLPGHWRTHKPKLMGHLHQYDTKLIVVDDAHDLSLLTEPRWVRREMIWEIVGGACK